MKKTIDFGEYVVVIVYEKETSSISVEIYDECEELIESIEVSDLEDDVDSEDNDEVNPRLN